MNGRVCLKLPMLFAIAGLFLAGPARVSANFLAGVDFSHLAYFESQGVIYKDGGQVEDGIQILKNHGINCVRLRLFTSSAAQAAADPYNYINNTDYTVPLAVRVKNAGLLFCLDFHYSDTWADPGHQAMPAAWASLSFSQLVQEMRTYNSNTIATFKAAGAMPDYVQVGNEITGGMLWPSGQVNAYASGGTQWTNLGDLINAAIQGIQDASGANMPKIIVHLDRGGDWGTTRAFFDNLLQQNVPFDIIGESYYPYWHGSLTDLSNCLFNAAQRYNKPLIVAETDFPWTSSTNIYGIPATPDGQVQFTAALAQIVKSVPNGLGAGIFWWGTEYQVPTANQAGFGTRSFFSSRGNVLPVADAFGALVAPLVMNISLAGSELTLQWPLSGAGMTLSTASNPSPTAVWLQVTNPVQNDGVFFETTLPVDATPSRFYRLQSN